MVHHNGPLSCAHSGTDSANGRADTHTNGKSHTYAIACTDTNTHAAPYARAQPWNHVKPDTGTYATSYTASYTGADAEAGAETNAEADTETDADAKADTQADTQADTKISSSAKVQYSLSTGAWLSA